MNGIAAICLAAIEIWAMPTVFSKSLWLTHEEVVRKVSDVVDFLECKVQGH